tara:strand:+ start:277 stop:483 length:207 start_codon:yes stop_codon:yes gene_type:complete
MRKIDEMKKIKVKVLPTWGEKERIEEWTLQEVLDEINRDRSDEWTNYDKTDWKEGWNEWVEGEFYSLV